MKWQIDEMALHYF